MVQVNSNSVTTIQSLTLDISESIHLKIGRKSHETLSNGSNLILCCLLVPPPINSIHALGNREHRALYINDNDNCNLIMRMRIY